MFVREHVALLLRCHDFSKGNAIDFYAQLRSKEGSKTYGALLLCCHDLGEEKVIEHYAYLHLKASSRICDNYNNLVVL